MLLATYNIHFGIGADHRYDVKRIAQTVGDADIICCQEVVQGWPQNAYADQAAQIAGILNRHYVFHGPFDVDGSSVEADGKIVNRRRTFGNMILSRWPIRSSRALPLPHNSLVNHFDLQRGVVEAVIDAPGLSLRVYSVHLSHVSSRQRLPQARALMEFVQGAANGSPWDGKAGDGFIFQDAAPPMPQAAIVMGDMNCTQDDPEYALMAGYHAARRGRLTRQDQLIDAWTALGNDEYVESFPREGRIDHCLVSPSLQPALMRAWIDQSANGSDHWPMFVELDPAALTPKPAR
jgi:endonuclease/exonuclease/phosphatase family metal-dependent hydrolase